MSKNEIDYYKALCFSGKLKKDKVIVFLRVKTMMTKKYQTCLIKQNSNKLVVKIFIFKNCGGSINLFLDK